jgi:restriction system protein
MGLLTNSQRGVWSVTELDQTFREDQIPQLHAEFVASTRKKGETNKRSGKSDVESEIEQVEAEAEADRKGEVLETLLAMSPQAFERLATIVGRQHRGRRANVGRTCWDEDA